MLKKLAELKVNKSADYKGLIVEALEKDGFVVIEEFDTIGEVKYSIAKQKENE